MFDFCYVPGSKIVRATGIVAHGTYACVAVVLPGERRRPAPDSRHRLIRGARVRAGEVRGLRRDQV
jgi:hypothetical protein